ncbi:MAG: DUF1292 domain-containing protein [Clostridiales bacterium]|nr:DUF1292 domain-containing protein [Clostridiales bacterium]
MEEHNNIVELIDEEGNTLSFEYLMTIDYMGNEYVALTPVEAYDDQGLDGDEVVFLRVEQDDNDNDIYVSIGDEEELDEIYHVFSEIIEQNE